MSHSPSCVVMEVGVSQPPRVDSGGDVGRSGLSVGVVVGGGVKTALLARGDHGGNDKKSRR